MRGIKQTLGLDSTTRDALKKRKKLIENVGQAQQQLVKGTLNSNIGRRVVVCMKVQRFL